MKADPAFFTKVTARHGETESDPNTLENLLVMVFFTSGLVR